MSYMACRSGGAVNAARPSRRPAPPWVLHDLRRTARSLLSRAGISSDHAERVMGHAIDGVEGVYDRHSYADEKAHALQRLSDLIESIINPPEGNVVALRGRERGKVKNSRPR
jgi:integrase